MKTVQKVAGTFKHTRGRGLGKNADCCWQEVGGVRVVGCLPSQQPVWWPPLIAFIWCRTLSFPSLPLGYYCSRLCK